MKPDALCVLRAERVLGPNRSARAAAGLVSRWLATVVAAAALLGAAVWVYRGAFAREDAPLHIALSPWPGYEFATLAREKGFFRDEGVEVRLSELSSLGDSRRAFERGQLDGFFGTLVEVLLSREQSDRRAQVALVVDYSDGADVVLAREPIDSVSGLRGRRVAVEGGSLTVIVLARALASAGMSLSDVTLVDLAAVDTPSAMAKGEIDAAAIYPPMSLAITQGGGVRQVFSSRSIPGEIVDVLAVDEAVIRRRPGAVAAFKRAFLRAQEYARAHPEESYARMAARQRITPAEFEATLTDGLRLVDGAGQAEFFGPDGKLRRALTDTHKTLESLGQIKRSHTGDALAAVSGE